MGIETENKIFSSSATSTFSAVELFNCASSEADAVISPVKIISWIGGEPARRQAGIGILAERNSSGLKEAIRACERRGLAYEIIQDPNYLYKREGD